MSEEIQIGKIEKKEEKKKRGRKPSFKPTQFDLDLLHLIRDGNGTTSEITAELGVAQEELARRLELLKVENLVALENDVYKLTVNGYNFYTLKAVKKVSLKKVFTGEVKFQRKKPEKREEKREENKVDSPAVQKHVDEWLSSTEVVDLGGKLGRMDLNEIIQRYGPTQEQKSEFLKRKAGEGIIFIKPRPVVAQIPVAPTSVSTSNGSEMCDLCKSAFTTSMNNRELAKYGHCFCGAAYHKECYDSLLSDQAHCIRCGKKLFLIIDKQSREVINKIKDVFE